MLVLFLFNSDMDVSHGQLALIYGHRGKAHKQQQY